MTREEVKEMLPVLQAFANGKTIESRYIKGDKSLWYDDEDTTFDNDLEYRLKTEPKYRPFANAEECWTEMLNHQPFGWLKGDKCFYNIVSVSNIDVSMANVSGDIVTLDFSEVMEDNTFADGTPFGVKIEEDYNGIK